MEMENLIIFFFQKTHNLIPPSRFQAQQPFSSSPSPSRSPLIPSTSCSVPTAPIPQLSPRPLLLEVPRACRCSRAGALVVTTRSHVGARGRRRLFPIFLIALHDSHARLASPGCGSPSLAPTPSSLARALSLLLSCPRSRRPPPPPPPHQPTRLRVAAAGATAVRLHHARRACAFPEADRGCR